MSKELIEQQTKELVNHMNDYQKAMKLKTKGEAAIFDKHRLPDGQFSKEELNNDLAKYRQNFAEEWGAQGWRNEQFVKKQIDEVQRPTEKQIDEMHEDSQKQAQTKVEKRQEVLEEIKQAQQPKLRQGPKPR